MASKVYIKGFTDGKKCERERILRVLRKYTQKDFTNNIRYIIKGIEKEEIA